MLFRKEHLQASCRVKDSKIVWGGNGLYEKEKLSSLNDENLSF